MRRSFDHLAVMYSGLERAAFGTLLERARLEYLPALRTTRDVLLLGEGDGRFLSHLLETCPQARVTCVERSAGMARRARRRLDHQGDDTWRNRVHFVQADARRLASFGACYDAVVTLFFLDCFEEPDLGQLVFRAARDLCPGGAWLYADFAGASLAPAVPSEAASVSRHPALHHRIRQRLWVWGLYRAFRAVTDIDARRLIDPRPHLLRRGLVLERAHSWSHGLLTSELWRKRPP